MEIREMLFGTLFSTSNRLQTIGDSYLGEISAKQWFLLACIKIAGPEAPTLSQLVPVMGSSRQNIKQLALKLEAKGFLSFSLDPADSRAVRMSLTPKCAAYWNERQVRDRAFLVALFDGLSETDLETATAALQTLERNMQKMQKEL